MATAEPQALPFDADDPNANWTLMEFDQPYRCPPGTQQPWPCSALYTGNCAGDAPGEMVATRRPRIGDTWIYIRCRLHQARWLRDHYGIHTADLTLREGT